VEKVTRPGRSRISQPPNLTPAPGSLYRQLEIFHAVMETHSVSAASRSLGVSQPSLSRSLKRLEDQLRIELFRRHRKRLVPTDEALRLFDAVVPVVNQMQALAGSIARIAEGQTSLFRFAATQSVGRVLVPRAIQAIKTRSPGLRVFLDAITRVQHSEYLIGGQGECILTLAAIGHPLIAERVIGQAALVALVPRGHPLAGERVLSPGQFDGVPVIMFEHSGPHFTAINEFFAGHAQPVVSTYVRFADAALGFAAHGGGIALVDEFTAQGMLPDNLIVVPLADPPLFTARLYWNSARPGSRHVQLLGDTLVALISGPAAAVACASQA
jgi:DNA-binding transcriptional LysR family regulator